MKDHFVIVIGVYPEVVRRVAGVLVEAGFTVQSLTDVAAAEKDLVAMQVAAIITSPYLPVEHRQRLAKAARRGGAKVVMLHFGGLDQTELADAVVSATPESVVEALRELLPAFRRHSA